MSSMRFLGMRPPFPRPFQQWCLTRIDQRILNRRDAAREAEHVLVMTLNFWSA